MPARIPPRQRKRRADRGSGALRGDVLDLDVPRARDAPGVPLVLLADVDEQSSPAPDGDLGRSEMSTEGLANTLIGVGSSARGEARVEHFLHLGRSSGLEPEQAATR